MRRILSLWCFVLAGSGFSSQGLAASGNANTYATMPEGAVLPKHVARFRYVGNSITGREYGYDKDGAESKLPMDVKVQGGAGVLEFGLTDSLTLQVLQTFVGSYKVTTNNARALDYTATDRASGKSQLNQGICAALSIPASACDTALAATKPDASQAATLNAALGASAPGIAFDTETAIGSTVSNYVDAAALSAVESQEIDGKTGPAYLEVGALWSPKLSGPFHYSVGLGFRSPMNQDIKSGETSITRDVTEAGLRLNLDITPLSFLTLSWQNQSEYGLGTSKYKVSDVETEFQRKGVRNIGFFYVKPSLGGLVSFLGMLAPKFGVTYDYDNELYTKTSTDSDFVSTGAKSQMTSYYAGLGLTLMPLSIPMDFELEMQRARAGKNVTVATDKSQVQAKLYIKF